MFPICFPIVQDLSHIFSPSKKRSQRLAGAVVPVVAAGRSHRHGQHELGGFDGDLAMDKSRRFGAGMIQSSPPSFIRWEHSRKQRKTMTWMSLVFFHIPLKRTIIRGAFSMGDGI